MPLPGQITTVTVVGTYLHPNGDPCTGRVVFTPSITAATAGALLPPATQVVPLGGGGSLSVALAATDDPDWANPGWTYQVTEQIDGAPIRTYNITVPAASGTIDLATVAPVAVPGTPSSFLTTTQAAATYLTQANAAATYLTQAAGLTSAAAAATYLTQAAAAAGYAPLARVDAATVIRVPAPTGNATTDKTNIDAAVAALTPGSVLQFQAGTYSYPAPATASNGCVNIGVNGVTVAGMGMGVTVIQVAPGSLPVTGIIRTVSGVANDHITFRDLTVDGNAGAQTGNPIIIGFFCGVTPNSTATDTDISVLNVEVRNCYGYGFDPHERTTRLQMIGCVSRNNGQSGSHDGFTLDACYDTTLVGCISAGNGRHGFNAVTASRNLQLIGCDAYGNGGAGYVMQNGAKDDALIGCRAHDNTLESVLINGLPQTGQQDNNPGTNNIVIGCSLELSGTHGVHLVAASGNTVVGNLIRDASQTANNTSNGIYLDDSAGVGSTGNTVFGNDIASTAGVTNAPKNGIIEKTGGLNDSNFVFGNRVRGTVGAGLVLNGPTSARLAAHNGVNEHPATAPYGQDTPGSHALLEWNFDPAIAGASAGVVAVSGTIYGLRVDIQSGQPINNIVVSCGTAAAGMVAGQCIASVIDGTTGTELGRSGDISGLFGAVGQVTIPLLSTINPPAGTKTAVMLLFNATTPPALVRSSATSQVTANIGLAGASPRRYFTAGAAQTSMPSSFTMTATTATGGLTWWVALS